MTILERLKQDTPLIFDGGLGSMLQKNGHLAAGQVPEVLNLEQPEVLTEIHRAYIEAGAEIITTNTFGAGAKKLARTGYSVEQVISAAVQNAKTAANGKQVYVALDVGPLGELLEPMGTLSFEEAYELFREQICCGAKAGADLILIETMTDLYEVKAGLLAAKEHCNLPVFVSMSYESSGRTFTGCQVASMAAVVEGMGADAVGFNCSVGIHDMVPLVEELLKQTKLPVLVQANAGLPESDIEGNAVYHSDDEEFARVAKTLAEKGCKILGGCCGTTPDTIKAVKEAVDRVRVVRPEVVLPSRVCTPTKMVVIDDVRVIGERINPTGKKDLKEALRSGDMDFIVRRAIEQEEAGAAILDVNVGLPDIDEEIVMEQVVRRLQSVTDTPLQLDSSNPRVLERVLRIYNGKAIVNSVSGEEKQLAAILPLVKRYGAAVVGLTLDENGIPQEAEKRYAIAEKIVRRAETFGIPREDVFIDALTLTASAEQASVKETLKTLKLVKERLGVKTVLGVSNISFGLPSREEVNCSFLTLAMAHGLDLAIINPNNKRMMDAISAFRVLYNQDRDAADYIARFHQETAAREEKKEEISFDFVTLIRKGMKKETEEKTMALLNEREGYDLIENEIVPALDAVGADYESGRSFLPQLIASAEAAKAAMELIRASMETRGQAEETSRVIILATVKGDIHDIGKNIVKVMLQNYGYRIIDLGRDVAPETIVQATKAEQADLVGLSALMTTTVKSMKETLALLKQELPAVKTMVGGAVLTADYAEKIGADYYAKDANRAVAIAKEVFA